MCARLLFAIKLGTSLKKKKKKKISSDPVSSIRVKSVDIRGNFLIKSVANASALAWEYCVSQQMIGNPELTGRIRGHVLYKLFARGY